MALIVRVEYLEGPYTAVGVLPDVPGCNPFVLTVFGETAGRP